jgi:hypothetical protein
MKEKTRIKRKKLLRYMDTLWSRINRRTRALPSSNISWTPLSQRSRFQALCRRDPRRNLNIYPWIKHYEYI